ncbi:SDR family NAD(P)-dependent oxidoreductase [Pyxidicoccus fallax]|uniref:SDR family NAD(P)-dependent oxidoreductase n=1 Tax=Pyxidicoccus fallax TaxID=394095 RepID=A0A848LH46_9BACT|nr:SDR family NAD(P)-dependent oxidoreductase [Pyxidicoccus fallax]NMO15598.1 SDR family NAD(P)-dependent oxidoreductase [Pyxidicoccus fallax]NPC82147.1 SDR family NAD(P)-dependent oxidoreductase [Pyxidicoccus fallax]
MARTLGEAKVVLITGGTHGVGRALVEKYAREGWRVATCSRREEELRTLEREVSGARGFVCDVGRAEERRRLLEAVRREVGPVQGLINNAAIQHAYGVSEAGALEDRLDEEVRINLVAPLALGHAVLAEVASRGGFIANVSSGLAYIPRSRSPVYCATKAALSMYTRSALLQRPGARFVEVVLPLVDTRMTAGRGSGKLSPAATAEQIHDGIASGASVVHVGKTRLLPFLLRVAPGLLARVMNREDAPRHTAELPAGGVPP